MKRSVETVLTNMCMVYNQNQVLVQHKMDEEEKGIVFPGGHVEKLESMHDSIIREIKEETGLTIYHPVLCGMKDYVYEDGKRYLVFLYKTNEFEGELKSSSEGEVFWIDRKELLKQNLMWDMEEILQILEDESLSELYARQKDDWEGTIQ